MENQNQSGYESTLRDKTIAKNAAKKSLFGTVIIVPVIMIISYKSCGSDPLCTAMNPLVGIVYTPIVFLALWFILYVYYQVITDDK